MNKKTLIVFVAGILIGGGAFYGFQYSHEGISAQKAADKALNFINNNIEEGVTASLLDVSETSGVYKIHIEIANREYESYVTKDGKLLFSSGISLTSTQEENQAATSIPQTKKPKVELFVMSFCPYGNQAENTMLPVYNLLKDKVDWNIHYIVNVSNGNVSSLHGQPEVDQNKREACVLQEWGMDKWWQFTTYVNDNCGSNGSCWREAAENAGLDISAITNCVSSEGLSLMKNEASVTNEAGVNGSPTLIINGVKTNSVYHYGNSQAYLGAVCSAFESAPEECSQQLPTSGNTSSGSGSCQ
ncbi:MAG: hypothetical protein DRZ76_00655 [Candidatus Nealsonbacteria bacterium]|nr:MAG: hypothetical protein DRZ76_00655 [Candidatus Nealsonbacteria bacterium]